MRALRAQIGHLPPLGIIDPDQMVPSMLATGRLSWRCLPAAGSYLTGARARTRSLTAGTTGGGDAPVYAILGQGHGELVVVHLGPVGVVELVQSETGRQAL